MIRITDHSKFIFIVSINKQMIGNLRRASRLSENYKTGLKIRHKLKGTRKTFDQLPKNIE